MSPATYTPFPGVSSQDLDENEWWLRREISLIENLLKDRGELCKGEIGDTLGCKHWGPLRFRNALKEGVDRGAFARPVTSATRPPRRRCSATTGRRSGSASGPARAVLDRCCLAPRAAGEAAARAGARPGGRPPRWPAQAWPGR
jgi:hypothetical protein